MSNLLVATIGTAFPGYRCAHGGYGGWTAGSAADFGKLITADTEKWSKVVKFAGLRAD